MSDRQARRQDIARTVFDLGVIAERLLEYQRTDPDVVATEFADLIAAAAKLLRTIDRTIAWKS